MNKIVYVAWFAIMLSMTSSCVKKETNFAIIKGQTTENEHTLKLYDAYSMEIIKEIKPLADGTFVDTLFNVDNNHNFLLAQDKKWITLYLYDEANIYLNFTDDISTATISGKNSNETRYLQNFQQFLASKIENTDIFSLTFEAFKNKSNQIEKALRDNLKKANLRTDFVDLQQRNITYTMAKLFNSYENYHAYNANQDFILSKNFNNYLTQLDYNNDYDYQNLATYRELVYNYFFKDFVPSKKEDVQNMLNKIKSLQSENIKSEMTKKLAVYISPKNPNNQLIYDFSQQHIKDDSVKQVVQAAFKAVENLYPGAEAVPFRFENNKGDFVSLKDLKGNIVYIDVWATWCVPCIKEIPYLQKIEKDFHNKNIVFVSISMDKPQDKQKWLDFIQEKQLSGVQLIADNAFDSDFAKKYRITGIPRFILIDTEGKIITADAPRPSSEKLYEFLQRVLTQ